MESAGVRYLRTRCFCIKNLTRSLRSLVLFLIRQQLVRKYRTPALSMKYSLYILVGCPWFLCKWNSFSQERFALGLILEFESVLLCYWFNKKKKNGLTRLYVDGIFSVAKEASYFK